MLRLSVNRTSLSLNSLRKAVRTQPQLCVRAQLRAYGANDFNVDPQGPNYGIIQRLMQNMEDEAKKESSNGYKIRAFAGAIKTLNQLQLPITSAEEAIKIDGIGPGIARRIEEFFSNPETMTQEERLEQEARRTAITELTQVPGIGRIKAQKLFDAGCTSLKKLGLPKYRKMLKPQLRVAVDFYGLIQPSVRREHTERVKDILTTLISREYEVHVTGTYRRAHTTSPHIDVAVFHPKVNDVPLPAILPPHIDPSPANYSSKGKPGRPKVPFRAVGHMNLEARQNSPLHGDIIDILEEEGVIAGTFAEMPWKWQGIVRVPEMVVDRTNGIHEVRSENRVERMRGLKKREGTFVKMDITLAPMKSRGAALLAMTGDLTFTRHFRTVASEQGLYLNEFGLWQWRTDTSSTKLDQESNYGEGSWEFIAGETEEQVLAELGIDYIDPEKRNFGYIFPSRRTEDVKGRGRPRKPRPWEAVEEDNASRPPLRQ